MLPWMFMKMRIRSLRMRILSLRVRTPLEMRPRPLRVVPVSLLKILVLPDRFSITYSRAGLIGFVYAHVIDEQKVVSCVRADDVCRHGRTNSVVKQGAVVNVNGLAVIGEENFAFGMARFEYVDFVIVIFCFWSTSNELYRPEDFAIGGFAFEPKQLVVGFDYIDIVGIRL